MPHVNLDALISDLDSLAASPGMSLTRLAAFPKLHIVRRELAGRLAPDASAIQQSAAEEAAIRVVLTEGLAQLGLSREARAIYVLLGYADPASPANGDNEPAALDAAPPFASVDLTVRGETAAQILQDSARTVQRNRTNLLQLVAEQVLYLELEYLEALAVDDPPLNIGWDGFQTDSWFIQWKLEKAESGEWTHLITRQLNLVSGGVGTMTLPLGAMWTGSGELETTDYSPSDAVVERVEGVPHRWSPKPYPYDLFFFGRNIPRGERVFVSYTQEGTDPNGTFEPHSAYRPRNIGVQLRWHVELPASLPPGSVKLRVSAKLPPHTHDIEVREVEAIESGTYQVNTTVEVDPKKYEDLLYQLVFDKDAFYALL
ncbi:MAG: hypothetical protein JSS68_11675 [Actinobacteria bacterium]|nr:hypothetical protein [Actinomycetota bacterium]